MKYTDKYFIISFSEQNIESQQLTKERNQNYTNMGYLKIKKRKLYRINGMPDHIHIGFFKK